MARNKAERAEGLAMALLPAGAGTMAVQVPAVNWLMR